ncbi:5'-nucleotidase domain-containing protein 2-like [Rhinophrynus dorsalis]
MAVGIGAAGVCRVLRGFVWRGATAAYTTAGDGSLQAPSSPAGSTASQGPPVSPSSTHGSPAPPHLQTSGAPSPGRRFSSSFTAPKIDNKSFLWSRYGEMKKLVQDLLPPGVCNLLNSSTIYANNEVCLGDIEIYGFDYDYTLALYSNALHSMIFNTARDILVEQYKYPDGIQKYEYMPNFAVRGLHYDINKGLLMKIDAYHYIQLGTVYRGLKPVPDEEVMDLYQGTHHIPLHQVSGFYGKGPAVKQFMDIFSLPEMNLLAVANDFFITHDIDYDPIHLYKDVTDAIRDVHIKGFMYKWIMQDLEKYILRGDETYAVLHRLASQGKKLFLITNSPFSFVDKGMKYMVGKDWRDFFDVLIVQADKPSFFNDCVKPFRRLDGNGDLKWDKITKLEKGQVYKQGKAHPLKSIVHFRWAMTKNLFNPQFGSIFRTCHNPTYFSRRLCRFSDLYMASISCLLNYDLSYTFFPRRTPLQHEAPLWMDQLCTGCMKTPFLEEMAHIR